jgi:hypothetical protein
MERVVQYANEIADSQFTEQRSVNIAGDDCHAQRQTHTNQALV